MTVRVAFGILVMTFACAQTAAAQAAARGDDMRELASYRLTMEAVNKAAAATRAMAAELKKDPRYQELMKIQTAISALEKKDDRTEAEQAKLEQLQAKKDEITSAFDDGSLSGAKSISGVAAAIQKVPPMAAGLRAAGMSPREYATFMMAMLQASMVAGFKKAGMMKDAPKDVNLENVKFVEEHEAELKALQQELQALNPGGGGR